MPFIHRWHQKKVQMEFTLNPKSFGTFVRIRQFFIWNITKRRRKNQIPRESLNWLKKWRWPAVRFIIKLNYISIENYNVSLITFFLTVFHFAHTQPYTYERRPKMGKERAFTSVETKRLCKKWIEIDTLDDHQQMIPQFIIIIIDERTQTRTRTLTSNHHFVYHFADTFKVRFCSASVDFAEIIK